MTKQCCFAHQVKIINEERYRAVYEEEMRNLDKMENEFLPSVTLSAHLVRWQLFVVVRRSPMVTSPAVGDVTYS